MLIQKISKIYRTKDWLHQLSLVILGFLIASDFSIPLLYLIISVLAGFFCLAYGYSFNQVCDKNISYWSITDFTTFFIPMVLAIIWAIYASFWFWITAAILVNTLYSFPSIQLKRFTLAGIVINTFLFGLLFFIGVKSVPYPGVWPKMKILILGIFFASWYIPAQLLHELSHAIQDHREYIIYRYWHRYLIATAIFIIIIIIFSLYIAWVFNLKPLFGWTNLIWISFLYHYLIILAKKNLPKINKAEKIRFFFRAYGLAAGISYTIALYTS